MPRKKLPAPLPKNVHIKKGEWYVGLNFPTGRRNEKGKIIYEQFARRCFPETADRVAELVAEMKASYQESLQKNTRPKEYTLEKFLEMFIRFKKKSLARRTTDFYQENYDTFIIGKEFGQKNINQIVTLDIEELYTELQIESNYSADRIRKLNLSLSAAFQQAVVWDVITKNPTKNVTLPKKEMSMMTVMTKAEANHYQDKCRETDAYIIFEFALKTAMRPQEYLALRWTDIDFEEMTVIVRRALASGFDGGGYEFKDTKTLGSRRTLVIGEKIAERLKQHRKLQLKRIENLEKIVRQPLSLDHANARQGLNYEKRERRRRTAAEELNNYKEFNLVFPGEKGKPLDKQNLNNRLFKESLKNAELDTKKFSLYTLRRTTATLLAKKINLRELADFMGHSDVSTTAKYYVLTTEDSKHRAANALDEILD